MGPSSSEKPSRLVCGQWHSDQLHRAGKTEPKRVYRTLQSLVSRRGARHMAVPNARRSSRAYLGLDARVQRGERSRRADSRRSPATGQSLYFRVVHLTGKLTDGQRERVENAAVLQGHRHDRRTSSGLEGGYWLCFLGRKHWNRGYMLDNAAESIERTSGLLYLWAGSLKGV